MCTGACSCDPAAIPLPPSRPSSPFNKPGTHQREAGEDLEFWTDTRAPKRGKNEATILVNLDEECWQLDDGNDTVMGSSHTCFNTARFASDGEDIKMIGALTVHRGCQGQEETVTMGVAPGSDAQAENEDEPEAANAVAAHDEQDSDDEADDVEEEERAASVATSDEDSDAQADDVEEEERAAVAAQEEDSDAQAEPEDDNKEVDDYSSEEEDTNGKDDPAVDKGNDPIAALQAQFSVLQAMMGNLAQQLAAITPGSTDSDVSQHRTVTRATHEKQSRGGPSQPGERGMPPSPPTAPTSSALKIRRGCQGHDKVILAVGDAPVNDVDDDEDDESVGAGQGNDRISALQAQVALLAQMLGDVGEELANLKVASTAPEVSNKNHRAVTRATQDKKARGGPSE
ncbi:uncharacterized protein EHS24_008066 [Apiotrichum porosum]|uniref:Uncharacterized protein n=1 Tax=Apiotrichum porosum TaxID=105984 RepID=A0A427XSZ6_9TREE|nr:uncharacterized protein EHS24_008066 [Apiotrichum porosum]RSH81871.1 hypothetical protein EHS24_008066 [Apiotrichum porosum]